MTGLIPCLPETAPFTSEQRAWLNDYFAGLFSGTVSGDGQAFDEVPTIAPVAYDRHRPFPARLLECRRLVGPGAEKDTRHVVLSLEGSGIAYQPGDALGVVPRNAPDLVAALISHLGCDADQPVPLPRGGEATLEDALISAYEIATPSRQLLEAVATSAGLKVLLDPERKADLADYLYGRDVLDVLVEERVTLGPEELVRLLRPLQHRLYSIASSAAENPGEVHLTVGVVRYERAGRTRGGVCSTFLADRVVDSAPVLVFLHENRAFRLPDDPKTPIVMVGPGTGIAPFRAFLEERRATGGGRAWLFFGNRNAATDFLYEEELREMVADGTLTRLDTAFSRDQSERIYVQQRMRENAAELFAWLEDGAHFYVCGDASRMAKDVDAALRDVVQVAGGLTPDAAAAYVLRLRREKRYARDVY